MAKSVVTQIMDADSIGGKLKSWPQRVKSFYNDVRTEMKKVTSPSFKEVRATTLVVIVTVAIFGVYFWAVDAAIGKGVNEVFKYFRR
jgi:preprotein translocase subunit SecE